MITTRLLKTTPDSTVFVGNRVYLGTKEDYQITDTELGLVSEKSILYPRIVRLVDNNKYDPHQSKRETSRRRNQLNG